MSLVRRWWPLPAIVAASLLLQKVFFESRYDVSGHAGEHLFSATAPFFAAALLAILFFVTPRALREPATLVASAIWFVCTVLVLIGNVRVVDALVREGHSDTPTDALVPSGPIDSAHGLANTAPWWGVLAAMVLTAVFWRRRYVSGRVAIGAAVLNVIVLPWIFPGGGVIVLAVARVIAYHRSFDAPRTAAPAVPEADTASLG